MTLVGIVYEENAPVSLSSNRKSTRTTFTPPSSYHLQHLIPAFASMTSYSTFAHPSNSSRYYQKYLDYQSLLPSVNQQSLLPVSVSIPPDRVPASEGDPSESTCALRTRSWLDHGDGPSRLASRNSKDIDALTAPLMVSEVSFILPTETQEGEPGLPERLQIDSFLLPGGKVHTDSQSFI